MNVMTTEEAHKFIQEHNAKMTADRNEAFTKMQDHIRSLEVDIEKYKQHPEYVADLKKTLEHQYELLSMMKQAWPEDMGHFKMPL